MARVPLLKDKRKIGLGRPSIRTSVTSDGVLGSLLRLAYAIPFLKGFINDLLIHLITSSTKARPYPLSLWGPKAAAPAAPASSAGYVSWGGLVDRVFSGRHLPLCADAFAVGQPPAADVARILSRSPQGMEPCPRSSALFCFFAQWFTDSFLRTDPDDDRKNTSNHEIDLCQIYGLTAADAAILRAGKGGLLKSVGEPGAEFPPRLFEETGQHVHPDFLGLSYIDPETRTFRQPILTGFDTPERRKGLYACGLERGNSTIFYSALNILFLREHNRICREIAAQEGVSDDDELFAYARNANTALLLKIIIEDYINHLSSAPVRLFLDVGRAERRPWYRTNRISAEFNLLYRWHGLTPDALILGGAETSAGEFRLNNALLETLGVERALVEASQQAAGRIALHNTPDFLVPADLAAIDKSRRWRLQGYNAYRACFGLPKLAKMEHLTRDRGLAAELSALYGDVDRVELFVGLLAEARSGSAVLGELMRLMVGVDAFSQALTNPLLSANVYGKDAFTQTGLKTIEATRSIGDIARRNLQLADGQCVAFARP